MIFFECLIIGQVLSNTHANKVASSADNHYSEGT